MKNMSFHKNNMNLKKKLFSWSKKMSSALNLLAVVPQEGFAHVCKKGYYVQKSVTQGEQGPFNSEAVGIYLSNDLEFNQVSTGTDPAGILSSNHAPSLLPLLNGSNHEGRSTSTLPSILYEHSVAQNTWRRVDVGPTDVEGWACLEDGQFMHAREGEETKMFYHLASKATKYYNINALSAHYPGKFCKKDVTVSAKPNQLPGYGGGSFGDLVYYNQRAVRLQVDLPVGFELDIPDLVNEVSVAEESSENEYSLSFSDYKILMESITGIPRDYVANLLDVYTFGNKFQCTIIDEDSTNTAENEIPKKSATPESNEFLGFFISACNNDIVKDNIGTSSGNIFTWSYSPTGYRNAEERDIMQNTGCLSNRLLFNDCTPAPPAPPVPVAPVAPAAPREEEAQQEAQEAQVPEPQEAQVPQPEHVFTDDTSIRGEQNVEDQGHQVSIGEQNVEDHLQGHQEILVAGDYDHCCKILLFVIGSMILGFGGFTVTKWLWRKYFSATAGKGLRARSSKMIRRASSKILRRASAAVSTLASRLNLNENESSTSENEALDFGDNDV